MSVTGISRRQFVGGAAAIAAATAVPVMSNAVTAAGLVTDAALPYPTPDWTPLDAKALARQGYEIYKGKHNYQSACCEAVWWPVIGELRTRYPDTWGNIPKGIFNFGGGGVNAWRAMCGTTNGGAAVLKCVTNNGSAIDEYLAWYEKTLLPSNSAYLDYRSGTWTPGGTTGGVWGGAGLPIPLNNAPKSKALSVLCHSSLANWRGVAGTWEATMPNAQSDRCGKLCYDTVYKVVTIINTFKAGGTFAGTLDPSVASCGGSTGSSCHGVNGNPQVQAKMKCNACHEQTPGDNHNL